MKLWWRAVVLGERTNETRITERWFCGGEREFTHVTTLLPLLPLWVRPLPRAIVLLRRKSTDRQTLSKDSHSSSSPLDRIPGCESRFPLRLISVPISFSRHPIPIQSPNNVGFVLLEILRWRLNPVPIQLTGQFNYTNHLIKWICAISGGHLLICESGRFNRFTFVVHFLFSSPIGIRVAL